MGFDVVPGGDQGYQDVMGGAGGGPSGGFGTAAGQMGGPALGATSFTLGSPAVASLASLMGGSLPGAMANAANAVYSGMMGSPAPPGATSLLSSLLGQAGVPSIPGGTLPGDVALGLGKMSTNAAMGGFGNAGVFGQGNDPNASDIALGLPSVSPISTKAALSSMSPMAGLEAAQALINVDPQVKAQQDFNAAFAGPMSLFGSNTIGPTSSINASQSEAGTAFSGARGHNLAAPTGFTIAFSDPEGGAAPGVAATGPGATGSVDASTGAPAGIGEATGTSGISDSGPTGIGGEAGMGIGEGGSGGPGGGDKIICNELHRQGLMDDETWAADEAFGRLVPAHIIRGYHMWALPVVRVMQRSPLATRIVHRLAQPWINEMAYLMGVRPNSTRLGRFCMKAGMEICGRIGAMRYKHGLV